MKEDNCTLLCEAFTCVFGVFPLPFPSLLLSALHYMSHYKAELFQTLSPTSMLPSSGLTGLSNMIPLSLLCCLANSLLVPNMSGGVITPLSGQLAQQSAPSGQPCEGCTEQACWSLVCGQCCV